ncbi:MAG: hypothetical protein A2144_05385 [Chloroflexi bacterium RBG_16_50_9]|nr:MAG: hypothetical protein A2144_05385 [Chloroflexi bacterium RBG_16_50_9]
MEENLLRKLIASVKCEACGQHYKEGHIDIIEHKGELWFLKVFCPSCHTRCLVAAIIREERAEIITDLTEAELLKFKDTDGIKADDLLEMHRFLKDFDGDFPRLFQAK